MNEINAGTAFTMMAFEARIHASAIKTSAAASLFASQEAGSAALLDALIEGI